MKKYILLFLIWIIAFKAHSHSEHSKGIAKIEMDVIRNGEVIGYSNYYFEHKDKKMIVKNYTNFKIELLGLTVFSILSEAIEVYKNDKLISFKSNTFQNDKKKFVDLKFDKLNKNFKISGSSFTGNASLDCVVGNWWNHKILKANKQISPLSGSIKEQVVTFLGKENIIINKKKYLADHFKLQSKDEKLPKDKKLNFDIWYDSKNNLILKVTYSRMGNWEYRLKNFK